MKEAQKLSEQGGALSMVPLEQTVKLLPKKHIIGS